MLPNYAYSKGITNTLVRQPNLNRRTGWLRDRRMESPVFGQAMFPLTRSDSQRRKRGYAFWLRTLMPLAVTLQSCRGL